jgi:hypothetical protein
MIETFKNTGLKVFLSATVILTAYWIFIKLLTPAERTTEAGDGSIQRSEPSPSSSSQDSSLPNHPSRDRKNSSSSDEEISEGEKVISEKLNLLSQILASKNDNDPRLDTEFRSLSPAFKRSLVNLYHKTAIEDRNGRGTIVFIIGRELKDKQDLQFLKSVLEEEPCLSLQNCKASQASQGRDSHLGSLNETSMNYPQLVTLNRLEQWIQRHSRPIPDTSLLSTIEDALSAGTNSPIPSVSSKASNLLSEFKSKFIL